MAEVESPPVTTEESLIPVRGAGGSLLDRWVERDPDQALKRIDTMVKMLDALRVAAIRATYPSDWVIHTSTLGDGTVTKQVGYLQDSGAERAGKIWGIEVGEPVIEEKKHTEDGTVSYYMIADAWSKVTGERLDYAEGARWSGDPFFVRQLKNGEDRVDPTDVRKAAYANLHGRAVRALSGLNGVPLDVLKTAGIDVDKVMHVNYRPGEKGGQSSGTAAVGSSEPVVAFGNSKGTKVSELEDKDLAWYIKAYGENVANPEKKRFKAANQTVLDALLREKEKRDQAAAHTQETGTETKARPDAAAEGTKVESPAAGAAMEDGSTRGKLIGDVWAVLTDVASKRAIPLMQKVVAEQFGTKRAGMSELTDDELLWLSKIPEANLKTVLATLAGK